ncbi:hypothetical protein NP233_g7562 [Leucocoprinus birnbaumii]|uniref:Uncharacterized protein n=1 Tax=Leucocoprinus birnbaumii TaxID=56174 RepID=A0AAD5VP65_9AGAR|nr:hypothetical protein NP233_g7562 [Leucocoprinus birnbaumii]
MEHIACENHDDTTAACKLGHFNRFGDEELTHILKFCFSACDLRHLRLVNKQLARLAMPFMLQTLAICTPEGLQHLIDSPNGPLVNEVLSKHVLCLEIRFSLHDFVLDSEELPNMCPNLIVVRFRFDLGVDASKLPARDAFHRVITHDSIFAEKRQRSHQTWLQFLSKFNPRKFEWVASDNRTLRLIGVHDHIRQLLSSWRNLELVFLDGICLVEDHEKDWRVWLPANTVAIRGPFFDATLSFLYDTTRIQASSSCHLLMLESSEHADEMQQRFIHGVPAISLPNNTLVTTVGWTYAERDRLVAGLTDQLDSLDKMNIQEAPTSPDLTPTELSFYGSELPASRISCELFTALFLIFVCLASHTFVITSISSIKTDVLHNRRTPYVPGFFSASKVATKSPFDLRTSNYLPFSSPNSVVEPMAIPSCSIEFGDTVPTVAKRIELMSLPGPVAAEVDLDAHPTALKLIEHCIPLLTELSDQTPGPVLEAFLNTRLEEKWLASISLDGDRYRRSRFCGPCEATRYFSITAVLMDSGYRSATSADAGEGKFDHSVTERDEFSGQFHVHPYGEINAVIPIDDTAEMRGIDGWQGAGWTSPGPGTSHYPTVRGGRVVALFFLPAGRIAYPANPPPRT